VLALSMPDPVAMPSPGAEILDTGKPRTFRSL
jgi:hypothetical protein